MRNLWFISSVTCLLVASTLACHPPTTCDPGDPGCEGPPTPPQRRLEDGQAELRLAQIHAEYEAAAADGLDADECRTLAARYQALYERDNTITAARFNVAAVHEVCGELERAASIYKSLGEYAPSLNNLGVMAWKAGDRERALVFFEHSVAADSTHAIEGRNNLAMALQERYASGHELADFERAEVHLQNILAVDTSNQMAYENLARLYYDRGRLDDRSYQVLANLVVDQALQVLEATGQRSADLHNLRGLLLMQDDDQVQALRAFKRAVEVEPQHVDANRNIAMIAIRFRDYASAEQALESVIEVEPVTHDVDAWIALGVAKRGLRKYDEAEAAYRRALKVDGSDPRPWFNLGILVQEHVSANLEQGENEDANERALIASYEVALEHFKTFIAKAGANKRWNAEVSEAKDRVVIVKDSIQTIETMAQVRLQYEAMLEEEKRQREAQIEEWKRLEAQGVRVDELAEG